jgi:murein DD-endopeptidase MepM/ murein hydrolase activator NlpD
MPLNKKGEIPISSGLFLLTFVAVISIFSYSDLHIHAQVEFQAVSVDNDGDGIPDVDDNCPADVNRDQKDTDGDGIGDSCDTIEEEPETDLDKSVLGDLEYYVDDSDPSQEQFTRQRVPSWVKTTSEFWVRGDVADDDFTNGLGYLVQERIIDVGDKVEQEELAPEQVQNIPSWIKQTTQWWIDGLVPEDQFLEGIRYMMETKIIDVPPPDKSLESPENECSADCLGKIIDTTTTGQWNQGLPGNDYHCKLNNSPPCSADVYYREPSDKVGDKKYEVRSSAIKNGEGIFTLPFDNWFVERHEPWVYNSNKTHRAIDYEIGDGWESFEVRAAAPGTVVFMEYRWWSGNTMVVSHDGENEDNLYRTIYMHIRNGAENDCLDALNTSIPNLIQAVKDGKRTQNQLDDYKDHLEETGCNRKQMDLDANFWGTDHQTVKVKEGDIVDRGQMLAWAGNTGPGGKRGVGEPNVPNVHLHIFFAKRDLTNDEWYMIDPYGIYGKKDCYPERPDDPIETPCARHQIHWKDGDPQYPIPLDKH